MVLDLEDPGILARITRMSDGRTRLVLEYDNTSEWFEEQIRKAKEVVNERAN